ncbi:CDP-glycerol glycerophosphotransferase family protein [Paeniglutamicibacter sulfureus]|uniref:CDP-glycerol glycerophosphotransferase family protein n=1 Tax=Paeniglutamicibacter sulfureus TaxID=43666 RepID=UPI00266706B7|nr:CDP-glycerol glycerophosphotransferase family protein [Paeniglutamicibacter sulfureus]MDO2936039.1 CDP-glycerol glycerophosphotransferase family protein [Paeniglutamicibacter sulfureus]
MKQTPKTLAGMVQDLYGKRIHRKDAQRKSRTLKGSLSLAVSQEGRFLRVHAATSQRPLGLSVLHGKTVIERIAFDSMEDAGAAGYLSTGAIDLASLCGQWNALAPVLVGEPEDDFDGVDGVVRACLEYEGEIGALPLGVAAVELDAVEGTLTRAEVNELVDEGSIEVGEPVRFHRVLGRAARTDLNSLVGHEAPDGLARPYVNKRGELVIAMNREIRHSVKLRTDAISVVAGNLKLSGVAYSRSSRLSSARLLVLGRRSGQEFTGAVDLRLMQEQTSLRNGFGRYRWAAEAALADVDWDTIESTDNFDLYLEFGIQGVDEPKRVRVARTPYAIRATTRAGDVTRDGKTLVVNPYYTFKGKATSLILEVLDESSFKVLQDFSPAKHLLASRGRKPVWLIGELPYKAQDNGYHFFRYVRESHPEVDAYYVIDKASPEFENVSRLGNVIGHQSKEHFEIALAADRIVGSHHPDYLYPTRHPSFLAKSRAGKVFLQHGVMGTKWMVPNYGKKSAGFQTDLFCVSSEREKSYIVKDFGYDPGEVVVTGLPRFDALFDRDVPVRPRQVLIIPTWRDWLQDEGSFLESDYFQKWNEFLHDPALAGLVREHELELVFCLHPNMQHLRSFFTGAPVRIVGQGEVDVQFLMKQSAAMVTDYSSVGFDFGFLDKPVHYFQFDRDRFLGKLGSHLDLDRELPGRISFTREALLESLALTVGRRMQMETTYHDRASKFIVARDRGHSSRVFEAIRDMHVPLVDIKDPRESELADRAQERFRNSRFYFPLMKRLQVLAGKLPMDNDLVVFESGLGKQYADSPRYIYEEMLRRGDTRKKVWIYSGTHGFTDPNTTTVKRLSPAYFWNLARAKYWVVNQNLPSYMTRRKNGVYVQTWHGTPLKRMLNDIEDIHGRDDGYLDRVTRAIGQWTHLLSPSPYATEAMRSAFAYTGPVLELGYPRNDPLLRPESRVRAQEVKTTLGIPEGHKVVLYAPTFRDDASNGKGRFTFELPFDLEAFDERFGEDTVLLLRMHVLVSSGLRIPEELRGRIVDVSAYPEIQDLYLASDVLITDYSSVFFDFALLRRPILFFAYDLENYRDNLRGFYMDYEKELPGPIVTDEDQLWAALGSALDGELGQTGPSDEFISRFAPHDDGESAGRVVDEIFGTGQPVTQRAFLNGFGSRRKPR